MTKSFRMSLYMQLLSKGNIFYQVLSSGVRLIFYTPATGDVLQATSIKHVTS